MRRRDKLKNIEQANMMLEQSYLKSKGVIKEDNEVIEEGWKDWLTAGLLGLSSIAGFYKLDKDAEQSQQFMNQVEATIDNMSADDIYQLVDDYNSSDRSTLQHSIDVGTVTTKDEKGVTDVRNLEDTFGKDSIAGGKTYVIDIIKNRLKDEVKKYPHYFLISKDGKKIKLDPEVEKTVGTWGSKDVNLKDMYKSK